jgi:hypothetical protein
MHYIRLLLRHHPTNDFVEHNPIHSNPNFGRNLLRGEHSRLHLLALVEILARIWPEVVGAFVFHHRPKGV